ncbi:hypothetical protein F443_02997 [Phytophthora nicotianae P1569]|uniref:Uncharacterized protein n=1 Tax=Phytophthora nicotianae P1569 TaxID=1317065 RepID=V9FUS0_PHYNI|nr:hypothetical protein F443_02997 [Phytophthora nicotianae P1569]
MQTLGNTIAFTNANLARQQQRTIQPGDWFTWIGIRWPWMQGKVTLIPH